MNREEFIAKLQMVYVGDRNAFNEIVGVYDNLKEENKRLNNFLNELKKWLMGTEICVYNVNDKVAIMRSDVLYKLNELKESDK